MVRIRSLSCQDLRFIFLRLSLAYPGYHIFSTLASLSRVDLEGLVVHLLGRLVLEPNRRVQGAFNSAISCPSSVEFRRLSSFRVFLYTWTRSCNLTRLGQSPLIFSLSFKWQRIHRILWMLFNMMRHCFPVREISLVGRRRGKRHFIRKNVFLSRWIRNDFKLFEFVSITCSQLHAMWVDNFVLFLEIKGLSCDSFSSLSSDFSKTLTIMRGHLGRRVAWNSHWICRPLSSRPFPLLKQIARYYQSPLTHFNQPSHLSCKHGSLSLILVLQLQLNAPSHSSTPSDCSYINQLVLTLLLTIQSHCVLGL